MTALHTLGIDIGTAVWALINQVSHRKTLENTMTSKINFPG
jgi:hypothetical protein